MFGFLRYGLSEILISVPVTLIALTVHECAHGWVSAKMGDPTPRIQGRLTLNPLAHLDIFGTILMILTGFGWAKPVQVNPMYYKNRKKGMALVAAAGPVSNLLLAILGLVLLQIVFLISDLLDISLVSMYIETFLFIFVYRNLCFAVFNLIPIPPLDGAKVLGMFLPDRTYFTMLQYERYFMFLIMALSLSGALSSVIGGIVSALYVGMAGPIDAVFDFLFTIV